jgi:trehalose-6-phosphate synthase
MSSLHDDLIEVKVQVELEKNEIMSKKGRTIVYALDENELDVHFPVYCAKTLWYSFHAGFICTGRPRNLLITDLTVTV